MTINTNATPTADADADVNANANSSMQSKSAIEQRIIEIDVAVAVIEYQDKFLLAYRHSRQHQGDKYEFVGGKIEEGECAPQALIREVKEEIGLTLQLEQLTKLGRISHYYPSQAEANPSSQSLPKLGKRVRLQVYRASLSGDQFADFSGVRIGLESQPIVWVSKADLLAGHYPLPEANAPILVWLQLPSLLCITQPASQVIMEQTCHMQELIQTWTAYHIEHLPAHSWVYLRPKFTSLNADGANDLSEARATVQAVVALLQQRSDIKGIFSTEAFYELNAQTVAHFKEVLAPFIANGQIVAQQITQHSLLNTARALAQKNQLPELFDQLPIIVSCHDKLSLQAANQLAKWRLEHYLAPVMGTFISPVKPTLTHPDKPALGWSGFGELSHLADMPVIALGGLSTDDITQAMRHGGVAVAGIRQFLVT